MSRHLTPAQIIEAAIKRVEQAESPAILSMLYGQAYGAVGALRDVELIGYTDYRSALDAIECAADARSLALEGGAQ